jgi:hypothetical protein
MPPPPPDVTPSPQSARGGALYANSSEGAKAVREDYLYWSGRLTDTSFQLSLAVIAANWAVFGSVQKLLGNAWAQTSLILVILSFALSVVGAKWMSELHRKQVDYAEQDLQRWDKECEASRGQRDPWPFTWKIEHLGRCMRELKMWLTLGAGAAFVAALLVS